MNLNFIPFKDWLKTQGNMTMTCPQCDGEGRCECECGHEHTCQRCDGSGAISGLPVLQIAYEAEKKAIAEKLALWSLQEPTP